MLENNDTPDPLLVNARELIAKADAELQEQRRAEPKLPDRPFVTGVVSFLFDPAAAISWGVFTFWIHVLLNILYGVLYFANQGGPLQIASVVLIVFLAMLGLPFALWFGASCLAIARDSANGYELIDSWPDVDITDCISDAPYLLISLSVAVFPGYVVGQMAMTLGAPLWVMLASCTATLLLLYPVLLLSMVKSGSPIAMLAGQVVGSLRWLCGTWCRFYLFSGCLGALAGLMAWLVWIANFILGLLAAVPLIAFVMIYHRLMGRLAWVIESKSSKGLSSNPTDD